MKPLISALLLGLIVTIFGSGRVSAASSVTSPAIEILHPSALKLLDATAQTQILGDGYRWTEGPLWIEDGGYLLFSDIPNNIILKYDPHEGTVPYLKPSGATAIYPGDYSGGSNGLLLDARRRLVLFQQGDRRVARLDQPLSMPLPRFTSLAEQFQGKRLNSPNDGVFHSSGSLYFTDPPYGLEKIMEDPQKQLSFQGVYRLTPSGDLQLMDDSVNFPNGIALSQDENTLYVAVSDQHYPRWLAYDVQKDGSLHNKRVFYDASDLIDAPGEQGVPDGMAVHSSGVIFATGPGGVWLFNEGGEVLAKVRTGRLTANCTLSADEKTLFITAHDTLMSLSLK